MRGSDLLDQRPGRTGGEETSRHAGLAARLPVFWLAAFVFGVAVLVTAAIYAVVISLSTGERGRAFASISRGLLPPMGIIFALLVGFLAAQVWSSGERCGRGQRGGVADRHAALV